MRKKRGNYTPKEKVNILKEHLVNWVPVSPIASNRILPVATTII
jgi:hypothetical protein